MALSEEKFKMFKYFLECYFNPSAYYSELDSLIDDFNKSEVENTVTNFQTELKCLKSYDEEGFSDIKEFIRKHGMRNMPIEKVKWFVEYLNSKIAKK
jgi:hypothetical protein